MEQVERLMILYKSYTLDPGNSDPDPDDITKRNNIWIILPGYYTPQPTCFRKMYFKIDGIVYKSHSEEFVKAYEQEKIWRALKNG